MELTATTVAALILVCIYLLVVIFNLLRKVEKLENSKNLPPLLHKHEERFTVVDLIHDCKIDENTFYKENNQYNYFKKVAGNEFIKEAEKLQALNISRLENNRVRFHLKIVVNE